MDKNEIRKNLISLRNSFSNIEVINKSNLIYEKVCMLPEFEEADNVLIYADYKNEVMTKNIFDECIRRKKRVFFPKCDEHEMFFYQVISIGELKKGMYGILEPSSLKLRYEYSPEVNTLCILPGVAFDIRGYRIGYGKGYYDRFLKDKLLINKVGLGFSKQLLETVPNDVNDIKLDKLVTEELVYSFMRI